LTHPDQALSNDLLEGSEAIAAFMGVTQRTVYRLSTEVPPHLRLPTFKLGSNVLCARRSSILRWIERQECDRTASEAAQPS
jgi:predicted DNA-binding transcriptional regulator AlpA